jgi:vitamin B12/bleomycin/antimicrobial peptide transport system ATP-binding/permease protein
MISELVRGLGTPGVFEKDDEDCAEERRARKQTQLNRAPIDERVHDFVHQFREFVIAIWLSPGRQGLALLTIGTILVICATAAAQVGLNAWKRPFYEEISARNFLGFVHQLLVFAAIAGGLLVLNVAQAWVREMIKLRSREWLTRDLFAKWLKPSAPS